jgi:hypothetical protein
MGTCKLTQERGKVVTRSGEWAAVIQPGQVEWNSARSTGYVLVYKPQGHQNGKGNSK